MDSWLLSWRAQAASALTPSQGPVGGIPGGIPGEIPDETPAELPAAANWKQIGSAQAVPPDCSALCQYLLWEVFG